MLHNICGHQGYHGFALAPFRLKIKGALRGGPCRMAFRPLQVVLVEYHHLQFVCQQMETGYRILELFRTEADMVPIATDG